MKKRIAKLTGLTFVWLLAVVILLVVNLFFMIYTPLFQQTAVAAAVKGMNTGGREFRLDHFRLRFPLDLEVGGLLLVDHGDTIVGARSVDVDMALLPLIGMRAEVEHADIADASFTLGTPDSTMYMTIRQSNLNINRAMVSLAAARIEVNEAAVEGGRVYLALKNDTTPVPLDTVTSTPWFVHAQELKLKDIHYAMSMEGSIDTLAADVPYAVLRNGTVDMHKHDVHAELLDVQGVTARYIYPAVMSDTVAEAADPNLPEAWTIRGDKVMLTAREALYAVNGAKPLPGLDMNYLQVSDIDIQVDSFYNRRMEVRVPVKVLAGRERCGLQLDASGLFDMDSTMMRVEDFKVATANSLLRLDGYMGMGDLTTDPNVPLGAAINGYIGLRDVTLAFPALGVFTKGLPADTDVDLGVNLKGTSGRIALRQFIASIPRHLNVTFSGVVDNPMDSERIDGTIDIGGSITNVDFAKSLMFDPATARMVNIAPLTLDGEVVYKPSAINGKLKVVSGTGRIAMDASWVKTPEKYDASIAVDRFPIHSFLPTMGIGDLTATVKVDGRGYDMFSVKTAVDAEVLVEEVVYDNKTYNDIGLVAKIADGKGDISLSSSNDDADFEITATGNLAGNLLHWDLDGDVRRLDLMALGMSPTEASGSVSFKGDADLSSDFRSIDANLNIDELVWQQPDMDINQRDMLVHGRLNDSIVALHVDDADMRLSADFPCSLDTLLKHFTLTGDDLTRIIDDKRIDMSRLQHALPPFNITLSAGRNNIISNVLAGSDMSFNSLWFTASNDTVMHASATVNTLKMGATTLDTIDVSLNQQGNYLLYNGRMRNAPGKLDLWASVDASGYVADDNLAIMLHQRNIKGDTGFMLGAMATFTDSVMTIHFAPYHPIIGYKKWNINPDNEVSYAFVTHHIDANLKMSNSTGSSIELMTEHVEGSNDQEDVMLKLTDIQIADWIAVNPFAPPMSGAISADMRFNWGNNMLNGKGTLGVANLIYGKKRVGDFDLGVDLSTERDGSTHADVSLMVDGVRTITASGVLNDSTSERPFLLDFSMIHFPLKVVNPFLPPDVVTLSGTLNGKMDITGEMTAPRFNGYLQFDSAAVKVDMLGTDFKFSPEQIPVDSNIVDFNNFTIQGVNDNPLAINGTVDLKNIANAALDLNMGANNMQIIGSDRPRGADAYGKAFIDLNAQIKGNMNFLNVNADLAVLAGSNFTYILPEAESVITNRSTGDMVHFVNFNDTAQVAQADTIVRSGMLMNIDAMLRVDPGTTINVDLSTDGADKVQIEGQGTINYNLNYMNDSRVTGRFNINKGFARYSIPVVGEKRFDFQEGGYVAFNGDMLNPILNIHAVDRIKANVTQEGQNSRLVNFNVGLSVTNTLSNMNVAFDLSTDDDITVENDLQSMSPDQRANQAMNILLYGLYTGAGTKGNANIGGNMLYSFLESTLNTWAANNIKGVDLSFGIDQYNQTTDGASSTTTSYSYQVSKSLFDNRFKIVVGGNYSTDANADENFSQNLINDISFEYLLNRSGTMYVRLFRHVGYESILEGEVTQTGVGFVYRRKISKIGDMFRWFPRRRKKEKLVELPQQGVPVNPDTNPQPTRQ